MSPLEIAGFATGGACVWLAVRENVWNFPWGIANTLIFGVLFARSGLYANASLQLVFLGLGVSGWLWWVRGVENDGTLRVTRATTRTWMASLIGLVVLTALIMLVLARWTDSTVVFWDAITTASSIVAQSLLNRKVTATWWWWMATDLALIALYASQGLRLTALLYVILLAMCVVGAREWRMTERRVTAASAS